MAFLIGILGILVTVVLHALFITALIASVKRFGLPALQRWGNAARPLIVAIFACALTVKHGLDIVLWALVFWIFAGPQFFKFEDAVYFSSVTYTTLGYGDIVIVGRWRFLCGMEAMNGLILFGLSTALLFVLVQRLWMTTESSESGEKDLF